MANSALILASVAAGLCFFAWPIRMNQSGLSSIAAFTAYASVAFGVAVAAMLWNPGAWPQLKGSAIRVGLEAAAINAVGVLAFAYLLAHATRVEAPRLILIVITIQTALTGIWAAYQARALEPRLVVGLALALVTVFLLRGK
jgi:hypothetical protein